jgi:hypothetical protein
MSFWTHPMDLLGDVVTWNLVLVHLEIVLVSVQDSCIVCTERSIGSDVSLDAPNGTPTRRGSCGRSFWSAWRYCQCRCKIGARFVPNIP